MWTIVLLFTREREILFSITPFKFYGLFCKTLFLYLVKSPGNVESWAVERRHIKSVPSLDWLNLSSGSEIDGRPVRDETTCDDSVREKGAKRRPYSAIGLLPRRRALEDKPKPWIRRSKTEVFFQSLENLDLDVEDSVSKSCK